MTTDVARKHKRMASYPTTSVPLEAVRITAGFWQARMETNRTVTIPYVLKKCEAVSYTHLTLPTSDLV